MIIETNGAYSYSPEGDKPLGLENFKFRGVEVGKAEHTLKGCLKKAKNTNVELCKY